MRKLVFTVVAVLATMLVGAGVAEAKPATYTVSRSWLLTYIDGTPTVVPHMQDDVVEVTCRNGDQMTRYRVNDPKLVGGAFRRVDGTGIQIEPEFTGKTERLRITVTCRRG